MPIRTDCKKRMRQDKKRAARNHYVRRTIKTLEKKMLAENIDVDEQETLLSKVYKKIDKAAKKGVIHKRTAARRKSKIARHFNKRKAAAK